MRVAVLTHEPFFPPTGGGSAEALYLVQEMVQRGHQVHVFCPRVTDVEGTKRRFAIEVSEFVAWRMGRYASFRNFKYLAYPWFLERLVAQVARKVAFDVVLSQHAISAVAAGRLKKRIACVVVMNFLDYLTAFMETWPSHLAPRRVISALKRFELSLPTRYSADAILTVSDTLAGYFSQAGYARERILPIYYGFDADLFPFRERAPGAKGQSPPVVVMHGSLDHHHLGPIALEGIRRVVQAVPNVVFRFVGQRTPAVERFFREAKVRAPAAKLECTGFVPYAEVAGHLEGAAVGIVPYEESTGVHCAFVAKAVEYLALGLPVVSTPLKGIQGYFQEEPLIRFSGFDGESFADQIVKWLRTPEESRRQMAIAASRRVRDALDWRVISAKAIEFIESTHRRATLPF